MFAVRLGRHTRPPAAFVPPIRIVTPALVMPSAPAVLFPVSVNVPDDGPLVWNRTLLPLATVMSPERITSLDWFCKKKYVRFAPGLLIVMLFAIVPLAGRSKYMFVF